jgi:hypothetical protein
MNFELFDNSPDSAKPMELLEIRAGETIWRHNSSTEISVSFGGYEFTPIAFERDGEEIKSDSIDQRLAISLPETHPVGPLFLVGDPELQVGVKIWRVQRDSLTDFEVVGTWQVRSVNHDGDPKILKLQCDVFAGRLRQRCVSQLHGSKCQAALYQFPCPVQKVDYEQPGVLTAVAGNQITAPEWIGFDPDYFPAGFVKVNNAHRTISGYDPVTGRLTLRTPLLGLEVGDSVLAYPGCNSSVEHCRNKFGISTDDGAAFVGFPHVPRKNIYGGRAPVV